MPRPNSPFTHFASLPLSPHKHFLKLIQEVIVSMLAQVGAAKDVSVSSSSKFHMTLMMLILPEQVKQKCIQILEKHREVLEEMLLPSIMLRSGKIGYFSERDGKGPRLIKVIYLELREDEEFEKLRKVTDLMIKILLQAAIIEPKHLAMMNIEYDPGRKMYRNKSAHITLMKSKKLKETEEFVSLFQSQIRDEFEGRLLECGRVEISSRRGHGEDKYFQSVWKLQ